MALQPNPQAPQQGLRGNSKAVQDKIRAYVQDFIQSYDVDEGEDPLDVIAANIESYTSPRERDMPLRYKASNYLTSGDFGDIYYDEQRKFLDSLGLRNPSGKQFGDDEVFKRYNYYVGNELARLLDERNKLKQTQPVQFGDDLKPINR